VSPTIGKVIPTIGKIDRRWIFLLFNKIDAVSDHGRKGFTDWFCLKIIVGVSSPMFLSLRQRFYVFAHCLYLFANGFVSSTIVFASSLRAGRLRPLSLSLCQRFYVSDRCLCLFANGFMSPTIVFVSSTMVFVSAIAAGAATFRRSAVRRLLHEILPRIEVRVVRDSFPFS
jgi:hypothetical protein